MRKLTHVRIDRKLYPLSNGNRWLAHDPTGNWYSYKEKPVTGIWFWKTRLSIGTYVCTTTTPKNWREKLYELY